uniref:Uncharacterized protein n=1 Tax=Knipowitschia caucasica TaxID=637954 RepID=A0AAV2JC81_KNICA
MVVEGGWCVCEMGGVGGWGWGRGGEGGGMRMGREGGVLVGMGENKGGGCVGGGWRVGGGKECRMMKSGEVWEDVDASEPEFSQNRPVAEEQVPGLRYHTGHSAFG